MNNLFTKSTLNKIEYIVFNNGLRVGVMVYL